MTDVINFYINFFVERGNRKFIQAGRNQNEEQSKDIDNSVFNLLSHNGVPFKRVSTLEQVLDNLDRT